MTKIFPVLMVGGSGTRLWPVSRRDMPKQFQKLLSERSLFQDTLLRVSETIGDVEFGAPIIIGAERYLKLIEDQMKDIGIQPGAIVLEPCPRSTTPVAAIAAHLVNEMDDKALALLLPSDHHIADTMTFQMAIGEAAQTAQEGWITTFGIAPTHADTGFGYIRSGKSIGTSVYQIDRFFEKPDLETAERYVSDQSFSWNAGIFLFDPAQMTAELKTFAPEILDSSLKALAAARRTGHVHLLDRASFEACDNISIDYSVMEQTQRAAVLSPLACGWSDVGNWQAIATLKGQGKDPNIVAIDTDNTFAQTDGTVTIAAVGVTDLVIVAHQGTVLIVPKDQAQRVQDVVAELKAREQHHKL